MSASAGLTIPLARRLKSVNAALQILHLETQNRSLLSQTAAILIRTRQIH